MLPFVETLLAGLASKTLVLAIDGSEVGSNCVTLMVSLIYQKRTIPLLLMVRAGRSGSCLRLHDPLFTRQAYGPVLVILWWQTGYKEPVYLVTNLSVIEEACLWSRKRMRIETFLILPEKPGLPPAQEPYPRSATLGIDLLEYFLNEFLPIPVDFRILVYLPT